MTQVLATSDFEVDFKDYTKGQVIDFADAGQIAHLAARGVVNRRAADVAAAVAAGATQLVHSAGKPAGDGLVPVVVNSGGQLMRADDQAPLAGGGGAGVSVVDNLSSTSSTNALSARQGKVLSEGKVDKISATTPRGVVLPSGVSWLNTGTTARTVSVSGGTVSAVYIATAAAPTNYVQQGATSGNFTVQPGGQFKSDWSVQPTVTIS